MIQTDAYLIPQPCFLLKQCEADMLFRVKDNQPSLFHLNSGGNRSRARLCIEAGIALRISPKAIVALASCIELLHNASLIHDDLQDAESSRRGRQSVWAKYGKSQAICAGDLMISAAYGALADVGETPSLASLLIHTNNAVTRTIRGQARDIEAKGVVSEQEYEDIAAMKSGPLIQLTLALPLLMSEHKQYVQAANNALHKFAIAYQIVDDLQDWQQDLEQGQLNFINLLAHKNDVQQATFIARNRTQYLLKQCEKALKNLPNNCASSVIKASQGLLIKANVDINE